MKKVYLLCFLFILTGCSVQYELDLDKNFDLMENITVNAYTGDEYTEIKEYDGYLPIDINMDDPTVFESRVKDIEYYDVKKSTNYDKINFSYQYDVEKFNNNIFAKSCYEYVTAMKSDDDFILSTSKEFLCFYKYKDLEDVTITVTSKYKLKDTNADVVERHRYTWYINKNNANNKYIYLSVDTTERDLTFWEKLKEGEFTNIFTISIILLVIGGLVYFIIKKKSVNGDKI